MDRILPWLATCLLAVPAVAAGGEEGPGLPPTTSMTFPWGGLLDLVPEVPPIGCSYQEAYIYCLYEDDQLSGNVPGIGTHGIGPIDVTTPAIPSVPIGTPGVARPWECDPAVGILCFDDEDIVPPLYLGSTPGMGPQHVTTIGGDGETLVGPTTWSVERTVLVAVFEPGGSSVGPIDVPGPVQVCPDSGCILPWNELARLHVVVVLTVEHDGTSYEVPVVVQEWV